MQLSTLPQLAIIVFQVEVLLNLAVGLEDVCHGDRDGTRQPVITHQRLLH